MIEGMLPMIKNDAQEVDLTVARSRRASTTS